MSCRGRCGRDGTKTDFWYKWLPEHSAGEVLEDLDVLCGELVRF